MRLTQYFLKTLRQAPAEAETISHQLLLRAGMVSQVAAGIYAFLPLGWRAIRKMERIIREEMEGIGGQEMLAPALQPLEVWEATGRDKAFGANLFRFQDRRERPLVLAPTHEEVFTALVRRHVRSYRDLPQLLFQIQTKFRDEPRPRGGLIRLREFSMKDLYSFDADDEGLDVSYWKVAGAYKRIFERAGLEAVMVEADSGAIGGKDSHEFMLLAPSGEDVVIRCRSCSYAANAEKAAAAKPSPDQEAALPLEEVATPGVKTIGELARFLDVPRRRTLKAVFYAADGQLVLAAVRGDLEVNEVKLRNALKCYELRLARDDEVQAAGLVPGSASAVGLRGIKVVADDSVTLAANLVAGANRHGYHVRNANYLRDFQAELVADIALTQAGSPCPRCLHPLETARGIEVGHIFKLGTVFSERLDARYLDREGNQHPIFMGSYGIGVERLVAATIEQHHDDRGILWPAPIAPFQAYLVSLGMDNLQVAEASEKLYQELQRQGIEVLWDDREESPGVKLNDADLLGLPWRVVVSPRTLRTAAAEIKARSMTEADVVPLGEVAARLQASLR